MRYPTTFNMKKYMDTSISKEQRDKAEEQIYDLYGVVIHSGYSTNSGHYYSYCKTQNGKWFECDDSCISPSSERVALDQEAYLLFYQKRITLKEEKQEKPIKLQTET